MLAMVGVEPAARVPAAPPAMWHRERPVLLAVRLAVAPMVEVVTPMGLLPQGTTELAVALDGYSHRLEAHLHLVELEEEVAAARSAPGPQMEPMAATAAQADLS